MAIEQTLSIIKPDAVAKHVIGQIYTRFEQAGLNIVAAKMAHLSREDAEGFYAVRNTVISWVLRTRRTQRLALFEQILLIVSMRMRYTDLIALKQRSKKLLISLNRL